MYIYIYIYIYCIGVVCGVMDIDVAAWVQILAEAVCISPSANTIGKSMHSTILPPAMGK